MGKRSRRYSCILGLGVGIFLAGCSKKQEFGFESWITKEECMFCSETKSIFAGDDILLSICNVNTGEVIDLGLGNEQNSEKMPSAGQKELIFTEPDETAVQFYSLNGRDMCEVSLYLEENSGVHRKAGRRVCQECGEKALEGNTEYVIADHRNKKMYAISEKDKLLFVGDYAAHVDWEKDEQQIDILFFYSPDTDADSVDTGCNQ